MPTPTYTPMANITLSASAASVTFSSISQAYRDVVAVASVKGADGKIWISVNAAGGYANSGVVMEGDGSVTSSSAGSDSYIQISRNLNGIRADTFTALRLDFLDYTQTDKHKPVLYRAGSSLSGVFAGAYRVATTVAVTSIIFQLESGSFAAGSTFALYGIAA